MTMAVTMVVVESLISVRKTLMKALVLARVHRLLLTVETVECTDNPLGRPSQVLLLSQRRLCFRLFTLIKFTFR